MTLLNVESRDAPAVGETRLVGLAVRAGGSDAHAATLELTAEEHEAPAAEAPPTIGTVSRERAISYHTT